ncbi:MAG: allophanate hydrolase [Gammaproteobacteria bacterium]
MDGQLDDTAEPTLWSAQHGCLEIETLKAAYREGALSPVTVVEAVFRRIRSCSTRNIWIHLLEEEEVLERARRLATLPLDQRNRLPLFGIPYAVKDNIDVADQPTTAACPEFGYVATKSAFVVDRLQAAGAILVGKTNMDQFATGLVGTRSPYGACDNAVDPEYVSGGSSSGSAVAVARGLVSFALGTDTAGSGRVPAAFNGVVGLKPTRGLLSTSGSVPACRSLDCLSVFTRNVSDSGAVFDIARGYDGLDPYSRDDEALLPVTDLSGAFRFGVLAPGELEFFGDGEAQALFQKAVEQLEAMGGHRREIDFQPFRETATLLYGGPWIAERMAAIGEFYLRHPDAILPTTRSIIERALNYDAVDVFRAMYRRAELKREAYAELEGIDVLVVPTTATIYTRREVDADPVGTNTRLGYYTNFVNLLDLCAIAVPAGRRDNGLPVGITLIGGPLHDRSLLQLAGRWLGTAATHPDAPNGQGDRSEATELAVAVVGAHLRGEPLNHQLTSRGGRFIRQCRTRDCYRLYALADTVPPKPGMVRVSEDQGVALEVEVWALPAGEFGAFLEDVPSPLCIGSVLLEDGAVVKGFLCEAHALVGADDISRFGGWRPYLQSLL